MKPRYSRPLSLQCSVPVDRPPAIQDFVTVNEWQIDEIKKGVAEAEAGDFVTEKEIRRTIRRLTRRAR